MRFLYWNGVQSCLILVVLGLFTKSSWRIGSSLARAALQSIRRICQLLKHVKCIVSKCRLFSTGRTFNYFDYSLQIHEYFSTFFYFNKFFRSERTEFCQMEQNNCFRFNSNSDDRCCQILYFWWKFFSQRQKVLSNLQKQKKKTNKINKLFFKLYLKIIGLLSIVFKLNRLLLAGLINQIKVAINLII